MCVCVWGGGGGGGDISDESDDNCIWRINSLVYYLLIFGSLASDFFLN